VDLRAAGYTDGALIAERCTKSALRSQAKTATSCSGIEIESATNKSVANMNTMLDTKVLSMIPFHDRSPDTYARARWN